MTTKIPMLLDEQGSASIATALMMSHHGFRRDLARFAALFEASAGGSSFPDLQALRDEWRSFRNTLHGHHQAEDTGVFPSLLAQHASLLPTVDRLTADHRLIDPLLVEGDRAFDALPAESPASARVIADLAGLLSAHLATEEAEIIPHLRAMRAFPPTTSDAEAEMYAHGFAWACHGIAPKVLEKVYEMLQPSVAARLPAARAAFEARWRRVWGPVEAGAALTPIPDR